MFSRVGVQVLLEGAVVYLDFIGFRLLLVAAASLRHY